LATDDEDARKRRAAELHRAIEEATAGRRAPSSPREFTDREAQDAAEQDREQREADEDV
jgi:hypothetical protein